MGDIIGERIKHLRIAKGLTVRGLANLADMPVSTLSAIESGKRLGAGLTLATARRLAIALGVTLDHLAFVYEEEVWRGEERPRRAPVPAGGAP